MRSFAAILSLAVAACGAQPGSTEPGGPPGAPAGDATTPLATAAPPSGWRSAVEPIARFDRDAAERPEGIAVGPDGTLFVAMARLGQIWTLDRGGGHGVFATLDATLSPGAPGLLGLAVDDDGFAYAALASFNPATHGVYRISPAGEPVRLEGSAGISWPNAVALDDRGDVYITDTCVGVSPGCGGAVWRYRDGEGTRLWLQDPLLAGTGALHSIVGTPVPLGANGIAYWRHGLYVANTEKGSVVRIPIRSDGGPGEPRELVRAPALFTVDGIAVDARGDVYAMVLGTDRIVRIDRSSGELDVVADAAAGLDQPVNAAFGRTGSDRHWLYAANYALFDFDLAFPGGRPDRPGSGVVRLWQAVPGR